MRITLTETHSSGHMELEEKIPVYKHQWRDRDTNLSTKLSTQNISCLQETQRQGPVLLKTNSSSDKDTLKMLLSSFYGELLLLGTAPTLGVVSSVRLSWKKLDFHLQVSMSLK